MKIIIYHNPRCSKSRQALQLLLDHHLQPEIIDYLKTPLSLEQLSEIIRLLDMAPRQLMRTKEPLYKRLQLDKEMKDQNLLQAMATNPILIERPIVIINDKAIIARPPEKIEEIL